MFQINTGESPVLIRMEFSKDSQEPESHQDPVHGWFLQLHAHQTNFFKCQGSWRGLQWAALQMPLLGEVPRTKTYQQPGPEGCPVSSRVGKPTLARGLSSWRRKSGLQYIVGRLAHFPCSAACEKH